MKKLSFALIALFVMAFSPAAKADLGIGLKGGLALSKFKAEVKNSIDNGSVDFNTNAFEGGFFIGPTVDWRPLSLNFGVDASLLYSKRGGDKSLEQVGLELPINARFYAFDVEKLFSAYIFAGPDFFFNFKDDYFAIFKKKTSEVGLNVGIGAKLINHVDFAINYLIPLTNSFESVSGVAKDVINAEYKASSWQFSLAFTL